LIFLGCECPISDYYGPEINRLCNAYGPKSVDFYLIYEDVDLPPDKVRSHAKAFGFGCPVVLDPHHALARKVGAVATPEAAVVGPDDALLYRGRIDDQFVALGQQRPAAIHHDLRKALDEYVAGRPISVPRTRTIGCAIEQ